MPSQIKVDEIKNVAGQYKIKTNVLEGQTTAGSITVQSEGSATTNLQHGLVKSWVNLDGTGTIAITQSRGVSSITDNGTGDHSMSHTNAFSYSGYAVTGSKSYSGSTNENAWWIKVRQTTVLTTTSVRFYSGYTTGSSAGVQVSEYNTVVNIGDLA